MNVAQVQGVDRLGVGSVLTTCTLVSKRSSFGAAADLKLPDSLKIDSDAGFSGFLEAGSCTVFFCSSLRRSALYSPRGNAVKQYQP